MGFKIFLLGLLLLPNFVYAVQTEVTENVMGQIKVATDKAELEDPVKVPGVVTTLIRTVLTTIGSIFIALIIYGGFLFINAKGEDEKVEKGRKIVVGAVIGLVIILMSYSITLFIGDRANSFVTEGQQVKR